MKGIGLILAIALSLSSKAQIPRFNRMYTNNAHYSLFDGVVPMNDGGFMCVGTSLDSAYGGKQSIFFTRCNAQGDVVATKGFCPEVEFPQYGPSSPYTYYKGIAKISENRFATAMIMNGGGGNLSYGVLVVDSNCEYRYFKQWPSPYFLSCQSSSLDSQSILYWPTIAYDGTGHLVFTCTMECPFGSSILLSKMDTALNLVWEKNITDPWAPPYYQLTVYKVLADSTGYQLAGLQYNSMAVAEHFVSTALLIGTDTSGTELWRWQTPDSERNGPICDIVRTRDGGWFMSIAGYKAIDLKAWDPMANGAEWRGKIVVIKLDSGRNIEWVRNITEYHSSISYSPGLTVFESPNGLLNYTSSFTDSVGHNQFSPYTRGLERYNLQGERLFHTELPYEPWGADSAYYVRNYLIGGQVHGVASSDGGIIFVGKASNNHPSPPPPRSRGWVLKTDSLGCIRANCNSLAVPPVSRQLRVTLYPNPGREGFIITVPAADEYSLRDVVGREVGKGTVTEGENYISTRNLSPGLYIVHLKTGGGAYKWIKTE